MCTYYIQSQEGANTSDLHAAVQDKKLTAGHTYMYVGYSFRQLDSEQPKKVGLDDNERVQSPVCDDTGVRGCR